MSNEIAAIATATVYVVEVRARKGTAAWTETNRCANVWAAEVFAAKRAGRGSLARVVEIHGALRQVVSETE
jgi:hypothetical protein